MSSLFVYCSKGRGRGLRLFLKYYIASSIKKERRGELLFTCMCCAVMPVVSCSRSWCACVCISRPYIIDLESTNGTYLNDKRLEAARYYELRPKDVLKFGFSSREYVFMHDL